MAHVAPVDALRNHVLGEIRIDAGHAVLDVLHQEARFRMGFVAEALSGHVDEGLGVDQHGVIDFCHAVGDLIGPAVVAHGLNVVGHTYGMSYKMHAHERRNGQHLDPEHLGPHRAVLAAVDLVQAHHAVDLTVRRELAGPAHQVHVGEFFDVDSHLFGLQGCSGGIKFIVKCKNTGILDATN